MAISTVNVKINGLFQNSTPFTGYVTFKLIRVAFTDDTLIFPKEGHRVPFKSNGESTVKLIPNSVTGEDTYYEYTVTKTSKSGLVMKREEVLTAICVVPETDCNLVDISDFSTASPTAQLYAVQAKAYRDEAKSYSDTSKEYAEEAEQHLEDITSAENALDAKITAEKTRATTAENSLSSSISTETTRATTAESSLSSSISAETTRATTAESSLSSSISAETTRATNAEDALSSFISAETSRASAKEEELQGNIESEANNRESAISTHNSSNNAHSDIRKLITDEISDRSSAISTSVSTHNSSSSAHSDIRNAITAEATSRGTAISSAIATEVSNRNTAIGNAVSSHNSANTAHSDIRQLVTAEATARENAVSGEASARNTAITEHDSSIESHADIRAALTIESETRADAVTTLNSGIATLSGRTSNAEKALKVAQRDIENLQDAARGTLYTDITDERTLHSKTLGDAELCGSDTTVLPNGEMLSIGGRTVVWNQRMILATGTLNKYGVTCSCTDKKTLIFNGTATVTDWTYGFLSDYGTIRRELVSGHRYYYYANTGNNSLPVKFMQYVSGSVFTFSGEPSSFPGLRVEVTSGAVYDNVQVKPILIDLTQMFGADIAATMTSDAFEALFDTSVYHPYNSGTLMSLPTKRVDVDGKNLYGVTDISELSYFDSSASSVCKIIPRGISIKAGTAGGYPVMINKKMPVKSNKISLSFCTTINTNNCRILFKFYDSYMQLVSSGVSGGTYNTYWKAFYKGGNVATFTISDSSIKYFSAGVSCTNEGSITTGDFYNYDDIQIEFGEPSAYSQNCRSTLVIPQSVKALTGYGWSAGSVCNEVDWSAKTYTQRVGKVDLGTLTWYNANGRFLTTSVSDICGASDNQIANLMCHKYTAVSNNTTYNKTAVGISCNTGMYLGVYDPLYTDAAAFKTAMSGVILYYELATPVVTDISDILPDNLLTSLETGGTVTFVSDGVAPDGTTVLNSDEQSLPVQNTIAYQTKIAS